MFIMVTLQEEIAIHSIVDAAYIFLERQQASLYKLINKFSSLVHQKWEYLFLYAVLSQQLYV